MTLLLISSLPDLLTQHSSTKRWIQEKQRLEQCWTSSLPLPHWVGIHSSLMFLEACPGTCSNQRIARTPSLFAGCCFSFRTNDWEYDSLPWKWSTSPCLDDSQLSWIIESSGHTRWRAAVRSSSESGISPAILTTAFSNTSSSTIIALSAMWCLNIPDNLHGTGQNLSWFNKAHPVTLKYNGYTVTIFHCVTCSW